MRKRCECCAWFVGRNVSRMQVECREMRPENGFVAAREFYRTGMDRDSVCPHFKWVKAEKTVAQLKKEGLRPSFIRPRTEYGSKEDS